MSGKKSGKSHGILLQPCVYEGAHKKPEMLSLFENSRVKFKREIVLFEFAN